jgi:serine/threonine protein kinase
MEVTLAAFQKRYQYKAPADLIGKGGFSDVYKAWDTQDEQFVALKIATASAGEKYDLTNEVKKIKKLKHPNLIEYYDLYEVSTGTKDIHGHDLNYQVAVMEYAEGGTLGDLLKNKPLTHTEAEELAEGIIDGLAYLHANNITHRDMKPANILLTTKNGKRIPKITDFGLAKNTAAGNTASTMLVGTVEYMAPEFFKQAEGETTTAAADVWSIGVILLEALTGIHPFGKTTQGKNNEQIIYNILSADFNPSLQNLHAPFKELITRCLIREPRLRPQMAEELKGLLQNAPNDFSERTQIIDYKPQAKNVITPEPKWKKLGKALFDFDLRNGNWKKILARELLLALMLVFFVFGSVYAVLFVQWIIDVDNNGFLDEIFHLLSLAAISIFFILRFVILIFNWVFKTLGIDLAIFTKRSAKAIYYVVIVFCFVVIVGKFASYLKLEYKIDNSQNRYESLDTANNSVKTSELSRSTQSNGSEIKEIVEANTNKENSEIQNTRNDISQRKLSRVRELVSMLNLHLPCSFMFSKTKWSYSQISISGKFLIFKGWSEDVTDAQKIDLSTTQLNLINTETGKSDNSNGTVYFITSQNRINLCSLDVEDIVSMNRLIYLINTDTVSELSQKKVEKGQNIAHKAVKKYFLYCYHQEYVGIKVVNYCTDIISVTLPILENEDKYSLSFFASDFSLANCRSVFHDLKCRVFESEELAKTSFTSDFANANKIDFCNVEGFQREASKKFK